MEESRRNELLEVAKKAVKTAYAPYSFFKVGAALLTEDGSIYSGCNIENAAYSPTICAERTALAKAVSEGHRTFTGILIVSEDRKGNTAFTSPCGVCRQTLREFCPDDFEVILSDGREFRTYTLGELLPLSFSKEDVLND